MKKIAIVFISLLSFQFASAATCVDITKNLFKGNESATVLALQNFLFEKGLLKATPNGYFGNGTFAAVKAYQKSVGYLQVGTLGPMTRAQIKKETCSTSKTIAATQSTIATSSTIVATTTPKVSTTTVTTSTTSVVTVSYSKPKIDSIGVASFLLGGEMVAPLVINGSGFSTSSNEVFMTSRNSNRKYSLGNFPSTNGTSTSVKSDFTIKELSCGLYCKEKLAIGDYYVTVKTPGGESNDGFISVKHASASSQTAVGSVAIPQFGTSTKLGTFSFSV